MNKKIIKLFQKKVVKNSIWIIGEKVIQLLISLILTMFTARYLGPSNYGIINYGVTFVNLFLAVTKLGIDTIIVNELINNKDKEGEILGTSIVLRVFSSFLSIFIISIFVFILNYKDWLLILVTILQSFVLIFQAISVLDYWFQAKLKSKYVAIAKSISCVLVSFYKSFLLITKKSIVWFALSSVLEYLTIALILFIFYRKNSRQKLIFRKETAKKILKKSYHFIISSVMVMIYTQIDKVMIQNIIGNDALGYYSAASTICLVWLFFPDAILTSLRPTAFEAKKVSNELFLRRLKQIYAIIFWICIACSFAISIFSKEIVLILYGNEYIPAINALRFLVWYVPFSQLGTARSIWIVANNKNRYTKNYILIGMILNIILNIFLIGKYNIYGVIVATIITEFFICFIAPLLCKETREHTKILFNAIFFKF